MKHPKCPGCQAPFPAILSIDGPREFIKRDCVTLHCECYRCHALVDLDVDFVDDAPEGTVVS